MPIISSKVNVSIPLFIAPTMPKRPPLYPEHEPTIEREPSTAQDLSTETRESVSLAIEEPRQYDQLTIQAFNDCLRSVSEIASSSSFLKDRFRPELNRLRTEIARLEQLRQAGQRLDEVLYALRGRRDSFAPHSSLTVEASSSYQAASRLATLAQDLKEVFSSIAAQRQSSALNHEEAEAVTRLTREASELFGSLFSHVPMSQPPLRSSSTPGNSLTLEARRERGNNDHYAQFLAKVEVLDAMAQDHSNVQQELEDALRAYLAFIQFKLKDAARTTSLVLHAYSEQADTFAEILENLNAGHIKPQDAYKMLRKSRSLIERGQITAELAGLIATVCSQSLKVATKRFPAGTFKPIGIVSERERVFPEKISSEPDHD